MFAKAFLLVFTLNIATTSAKLKIDRNSSWRIIGGKPAADGAHPHQVSLIYTNTTRRGMCGGSIVDEEWVITSAYCAYNLSPRHLEVLAGTNTLSKGGDIYKVLEIYVHESFNLVHRQNDVAILKVEPIKFSRKVALILVDTAVVGVYEPCVFSGWGYTLWDGHQGRLPDKLQEIKLKTTSGQYCKSKHNRPVIESNICTLTTEGEGACLVDSGGALTREVIGIRRLIGIFSYVNSVDQKHRCAKEHPDVYARVTSFIPWFLEKCNNCLK